MILLPFSDSTITNVSGGVNYYHAYGVENLLSKRSDLIWIENATSVTIAVYHSADTEYIGLNLSANTRVASISNKAYPIVQCSKHKTSGFVDFFDYATPYHKALFDQRAVLLRIKKGTTRTTISLVADYGSIIAGTHIFGGTSEKQLKYSVKPNYKLSMSEYSKAETNAYGMQLTQFHRKFKSIAVEFSVIDPEQMFWASQVLTESGSTSPVLISLFPYWDEESEQAHCTYTVAGYLLDPPQQRGIMGKYTSMTFTVTEK